MIALRRFLTWCLICFALASLCGFRVSARVWTSAQGSRVEAEVVGFDRGQVSLKTPDGRVLKLHASQLGKDDQQVLRELLKSNPGLNLSSEPLFPVKVDGKYGYINARGAGVVAPRFRRAEAFSEGLGLVQGEYPGFINALGVAVIGVDQPGPGDEYGGFSDGLAPFRKDGKWGLLDRFGKVVLEPSYAEIGRFCEHRARVRTPASDPRGGGKWGFINPGGNLVIPPRYKDAQDFSDGLAAVNVEGVAGKWGFIDAGGATVIPPQFHTVYAFFDGLARAMPKDGGGFGLIDKQGNFVVSKEESVEKQGTVKITRTTWCSPGDFGCGVAPVHLRGELFLVDRKGQRTTKTLPYESIGQFVEGLAVYQQGELAGYVDTTGKVVIPARFEQAHPFSNGLARVAVGPESGYIDRRGQFIWKGPN